MRLQAVYWGLLSKKQAAARLPCNLFAIDLFNASEASEASTSLVHPCLFFLVDTRYIYMLHNYSTRSRITYLSKVTI